MTEDFYVVRYVDGTPLAQRKHDATLGRFPDFGAAEDHRLAQTYPERLDTFRRKAGGA